MSEIEILQLIIMGSILYFLGYKLGCFTGAKHAEYDFKKKNKKNKETKEGD